MADLKLSIPLPSLGLVVDRPAEYVDTRAAVNIKNMDINRSVIKKRPGTIQVGLTLSERIQRYFELQVGDSTRLFRVGLTQVQILNKSTGVWSSITATALTGLESDPVSFTFPLLSGAKIAVYTNGRDNIRKCSITGSDANLGGSPPKAKYVLAVGPYLLLAHITDGANIYYNRVQWCDTGSCETWTGGNAGSQDLIDDPEDITGVGLFGSSPTIHKANSIYVGQLVTTSDVFRFDRKATGVGAITGNTIANIPSGEQIFLASDGIHLFNGVTAPLIDSPMQDELREEMNSAYLYKAQGIFIKEVDEYWVCVPIGSDTEPNTVYKYNWRTGQIYKDYRTNLTALGLFLNTTDLTWDDMTSTWDSSSLIWNSNINQSLNPIVIFGDSSGISTERTPTSNDDNGTAVESIWDTKDFTAADLGVPDISTMFRWKGLSVWAKGQSMKVYYSINGGSSWVLATTLTLASDYPSDDAPLNVYFDVVSSQIRFRFYNNQDEELFHLKKYQVQFSQRESRK